MAKPKKIEDARTPDDLTAEATSAEQLAHTGSDGIGEAPTEPQGATMQVNADHVETVDDGPPAAPSDFVDPNEPKSLTEEQAADLRRASVEQIREALTHDMNPGYRSAFELELARREAQLDSALGIGEPVHCGLFEVVKSTHVMRDGMLTTLAKGSIVSEETHDLNMLRMHGVQLEEVKGSRVQVERDQFDRPRTVVR